MQRPTDPSSLAKADARADHAPIRVHAAGSLKAAFADMARAMAAEGLAAPALTFGASGLLRDRIAGGEACDVFASANIGHPRALAARGDEVRVFARNTLCALTRADLGVTSETLLERMLDPRIRLGTSTPGADPSGDYALAAIAKADALQPGAAALLRAKARALTGGPSTARPASTDANGKSVYSEIMAEGDADIFLTYVTNALTVTREVPGTTIVALPPHLAVAAEYGLAVLSGRKAASAVADWIMSAAGQDILARHGFQKAGVPIEEERT